MTVRNMRRWAGENPLMAAILLAWVACTLLGVVWASGGFGPAPREERLIPASMDAMRALPSTLMAG